MTVKQNVPTDKNIGRDAFFAVMCQFLPPATVFSIGAIENSVASIEFSVDPVGFVRPNNRYFGCSEEFELYMCTSIAQAKVRFNEPRDKYL